MTPERKRKNIFSGYESKASRVMRKWHFSTKKVKDWKKYIFLLPNWFWWDHKSEKIVSSSFHKMLKMNSFNRTILVLGLLLPMVFTLAPSQIRLDPDGGYTGIVIKIDKEVPEEMCTQILSNLQVRTHQFICREKKYKG